MPKMNELPPKVIPYLGGEKIPSTDVYDDNISKNLTINGIHSFTSGASVTVINELSQLGTPVLGYYKLPAGKYEIDIDLDITSEGADGIEFIDLGVYFLMGINFPKLSGGGTLPLIKSSVVGQTIIIENLRFSTPLGTAIDLANGSSLTTERISFIGCKKSMNIFDFDFVTSEGGLFHDTTCENGVTFNQFGVVTIYRPQWPGGTGTNGIGFEFAGTGSRVILTAFEGSTAATESAIKIDNSYTGIFFANGVYTPNSGNMYDPTGRTQDEPGIFSNIFGAAESGVYAWSYIDNNPTTTTCGATPVKIDTADWVDDTSELIEVSSDGKWIYKGISPRKLTFNIALTIDAQAINQGINIFLAKNGGVVLKTKHQSKMNKGGIIPLFAILDAVPNDYFEVYMSNDTSTTNNLVPHGSLKIG